MIAIAKSKLFWEKKRDKDGDKFRVNPCYDDIVEVERTRPPDDS